MCSQKITRISGALQHQFVQCRLAKNFQTPQPHQVRLRFLGISAARTGSRDLKLSSELGHTRASLVSFELLHEDLHLRSLLPPRKWIWRTGETLRIPVRHRVVLAKSPHVQQKSGAWSPHESNQLKDSLRWNTKFPFLRRPQLDFAETQLDSCGYSLKYQNIYDEKILLVGKKER